MKKPINITYGVEETPPFGVTLVTAFQHVVLMLIRLVFAIVVAREAGLAPEGIADIVSVSMIVMGTAVVLQALPRGPVGSGYLCPSAVTSVYLAPSLVAARAGGMSLVFGMTLFGGLVEATLSRLLRPLRPLFPPEVAGLVVTVVGVTVGALGIRNMLGVGAPQSASMRELIVVAACLGTMIVLNVWGKGFLRMYCVLIGMAVGYLGAAFLGILTAADFARVGAAPFVRLPNLEHMAWSFDLGLAIPFAVGAMASSLKAVGDVTTCQKINDANWIRPDMRSISGGVLANGLSTMWAGLLGTIGVNTQTSGVGLTNATGVTSRRVAYAIGSMFLLFAFLPKAGALLTVMPRPVLGAVLLFTACFILINGFQIITSRMLDPRRTFVIGLAFMGALAVDLYPAFFRSLPPGMKPFLASSLVLGALTAVVLNAIFRLGIRRTQTLSVNPAQFDPEKVEEFMEAQGTAWGARRDVIDRASFNLAQSIETIVEGCDPQGPLTVEASFDEFNLDLRVSYPGAPLELPEVRPSNEEIMASEDGQRKLAGFLLRRLADRVQATRTGDRSTLLFHFDH